MEETVTKYSSLEVKFSIKFREDVLDENTIFGQTFGDNKFLSQLDTLAHYIEIDVILSGNVQLRAVIHIVLYGRILQLVGPVF